MGIITKIEEQKNKNRVNIYIDDSFFCGLEKETAIIFGLKTGKEIDEEYLNEAVSKSEEKRAFDKAIDYISIRNHSRKEITDKLIKKGFSKQVTSNAVKKLEEYHYIDDEIFAKSFIEQNNNYPKMVIITKLMQKGIDKEIIDKYIDIIDDENELNNCVKIMQKILKTHTVESYKDKQNLYAKLARRGFKSDIILKSFDILKIKSDIE